MDLWERARILIDTYIVLRFCNSFLRVVVEVEGLKRRVDGDRFKDLFSVELAKRLVKFIFLS